MLKVNKNVIKQCASNMMFELTDEEIDTILSEFDTIYTQVAFLGSIKDVDLANPMTFPYKEHNSFLAEDIPLKPLNRNLSLKNSPTVMGNQIKLPKVVGDNSYVDE